MIHLDGKVALITGAARGQGAAEAQLFAAAGASVIITDILEEDGESTAQAIRAAGGKARFHPLDITDADQWRRVADSVEQDCGGLDILINNAGANQRNGLSQTSRAQWDKLLEINLTGAMLGIQTCTPLFKRRGGGSIVNVGSLAGVMGHPTTAYSSAKWGLRGLTKSAALELAPFGIRVNAMHPGLVDTPIIDPSSPFYQALKAMTPLGRAGQVEELARTVLFLASDWASFITGIDLAVDGGFSEFGAYAEVWRRALADEQHSGPL